MAQLNMSSGETNWRACQNVQQRCSAAQQQQPSQHTHLQERQEGPAGVGRQASQDRSPGDQGHAEIAADARSLALPLHPAQAAEAAHCVLDTGAGAVETPSVT